MLTPRLYREYRLKSYLNMNHYITIAGTPGETHPHTWEFVFVIVIKSGEFVQFSTFEREIDKFLDKYQNHVLNNVEPFTEVNPTLENVSDYFAGEIRKIIKEQGGLLVSLEGSETPTRSYIITFDEEEEYVDEFKAMTDERIASIVDSIVDRIVEE